MALKGALVGWLGSGGGETLDYVDLIMRGRYPEGRFIPWGRGLYGGFPLTHPNVDRRDIARVPMGPNVSAPGSRKPTSSRIPTVAIPRGTPARVPVSIVRGEPLFEKRRLPVVKAPLPILPQVMPSPAPTGAGLAKKDTEMGLDLGAIGSVFKAVGGAIPGPYDFFDTTGNLLQGFAGNTGAVTSNPVVTPVPTQLPTGGGIGGGGIPTLPVQYDGCGDDDPMKGYVMKKVCGQWRWIKPKRRRRKVLLTESDYNGLLRIESLKVNKNMTIAIAKALSR